MAEITSYTAARMKQIEDSAIVGGHIDGDDLILERFDAGTVNAGDVRGPQGLVGPPGDMGGPGSSTDGTLAVFEGTSGTELREGELEIPNISQRLLEALVYSEVDAGRYDAGALYGVRTSPNTVFVNSGNALRPYVKSSTTVRVGTGVGWISKPTPANKRRQRIGFLRGADEDGMDITYVSPGAASFRRAYVLLTFQDDGEIVPSFGYGTASAVNHAGSTLPTITDDNVVTCGIVNVTNEQVVSVADYRLLVGGRVHITNSDPPAKASGAAKAGEMHINTVSKALRIYYGTTLGYTPPWNLPWGVVAYKQLASTSGGFPAGSWATPSTLKASFTAMTGRLYKVTYQVGAFADTSATWIDVGVRDGSTTLAYVKLQTPGAGLVGWSGGHFLWSGVGAKEFALGAFHPSDSFGIYAPEKATTITIEDVGPA